MFTRPGTTNLSQSIMIPVTCQDVIDIFFEFLRIWGPNPTVNSNDAIPRLQKLLSVVAETRWPGVGEVTCNWIDLEEPGAPSTRVFFFGQRKASWCCGLELAHLELPMLSNAYLEYLEYLALITARYASCQMLKIIDSGPKRSLKVLENTTKINANNLFKTENQ